MKKTRPAIAAAIAVSAALLFTGCASGSAGSATTAARDCGTLGSEVRDISNGAQNQLAGDLSDADAQSAATEYLDSLGERTDKLEDTWKSDSKVSDALDKLGDSLDAAKDYVGTVPTDGSDPDADAQAKATGDIQDAANGVNSACSSK
ncbi:hypothetical protein WDJ51_11615 [Rathayibacter sp. YIM 133350]|uniref:hypothetical protein n=1 Tax=Rathayibacter sp. YIM 133350 TaxID=3131992 RepID=UPI00307DA681